MPMKLTTYIIILSLFLNCFNLTNCVEIEIEEIEIEFCIQLEENSIARQIDASFVNHIYYHVKNNYNSVYLSEEQQPPEQIS